MRRPIRLKFNKFGLHLLDGQMYKTLLFKIISLNSNSVCSLDELGQKTIVYFQFVNTKMLNEKFGGNEAHAYYISLFDLIRVLES